ncbi:MAG: hypothetical protein H7Y09_08000 [Chitinophagaceae bacterium]|nr:hypothetical protein [Anaerolineae bacterium]
MPPRESPETRSMTLVDIPLVSRLAEKGVLLDSEMIYTRDAQGPNGGLFSNLLLPQRGYHTLLTRADKQQVVGQFRMRTDQPTAQMVYIAPGLEDDEDNTAWLHVLDAIVREAGKHNAHTLTAEVSEESTLFETMRNAGFAVYARQQIWRWVAGDAPLPTVQIELTEQTEADALGIQSLFTNTVPKLVQQIALPSAEMSGMVYRKNERVEAHIALSEGKHGVYIIPHIHPDSSLEATAIFIAVLHRLSRTKPVYVCVRRHQDWLASALERLEFEPGMRQAVLVRHITAGVRHANFAPIYNELGAQPVKQPTKPLKHNILEPM